jgi:hypothetical protein
MWNINSLSRPSLVQLCSNELQPHAYGLIEFVGLEFRTELKMASGMDITKFNRRTPTFQVFVSQSLWSTIKLFGIHESYIM